MQILSVLLNDAVASRRITPFKCKNWSFSHAMYADDLMISIRANTRSVSNLQKVLDSFSLSALRCLLG